MPQSSLVRIWHYTKALPDVVKVIGVLITAVTVLAAATGSVKAGLQLPGKLDAHMRQADTLIAELRTGNTIARQNQCLMISPKVEWPKCLVAR